MLGDLVCKHDALAFPLPFFLLLSLGFPCLGFLFRSVARDVILCFPPLFFFNILCCPAGQR